MAGKTRKKRKAVPPLLRRLRKHFGADPAELPVLEQQFSLYERPNLHLAVEEMTGGPDRQAVLVGVLVPEDYHSPSLARLSHAAAARRFEEGPVEYADEPLPGGRSMA